MGGRARPPLGRTRHVSRVRRGGAPPQPPAGCRPRPHHWCLRAGAGGGAPTSSHDNSLVNGRRPWAFAVADVLSRTVARVLGVWLRVETARVGSHRAFESVAQAV